MLKNGPVQYASRPPPIKRKKQKLEDSNIFLIQLKAVILLISLLPLKLTK
jgi:hypothetical protein